MSPNLSPGRSPEQQKVQDERDLAVIKKIRLWTPGEISEEVRSWEGAGASFADIPYFKDFAKVSDGEMLYLQRLRELTVLGTLSNDWFGEAYIVPSSTGPWLVVGDQALIVEAVGRSSMVISLRGGILEAFRPMGVASPVPGPDRWRRLAFAGMSGRAGLVWTGPPKKKGK